MDIELPEQMHLYAQGVKGYKSVSLDIQEDPSLKIHNPEYPDAKIMYLEVIKEEVPIYKNSVRISRDLTLSPGYRQENLVVSAALNYQACDENICYLPVEVPVTFELEIQDHDMQRAPNSLPTRPAVSQPTRSSSEK